MALINQAIASLFNGVSQQPAQLRQSSQCEASENFYPTIATGLNKRAPTVHKAKLTNNASTACHVAVLNRDASERYVLVIRNGTLEVFDAFTGASKTVSFPNGYGYLASANASADFTTVSVADYTFIVNKTVKVATVPGTKTPASLNVGYVSFSYSGAGVTRTLTVTANGVSASYSGSADDIGPSITAISSGLSSGLGAGWSVTVLNNNIIRIERTGSTDTSWSLTASDTYGQATMKVIKGSVQLFSDLPLNLDDGYVCYITSHPQDSGKGYYVKYNASSRAYVECAGPDIQTTLDKTTMPHTLVRNSDGTFTFSPIDWGIRKVGDYASNPWPSFVGRTLNDAFFYRNRLGLLSDENVILSEAGEFFNFFGTTVTSVLDSDVIDLNVATTKVSILRFAIPFNKSLMLFSDQSQFQLHAQDILTPRTVKADPVTEFVSSKRCKPVGAGPQLFFVSDRTTNSGVREYYVDQDTMTNDAADITAHVPSYVPIGVFKQAVSTTEDVLFMLSSQDPSAVYVYKYYWGPQEKLQSAWSRFRFNAGDTVMGVEFIGSVAYFVIARADGLYLEEMNIQAGALDAGLPFNVLLDRKVSLTGTYDAGTNKTTWTLPYPVPSGAAVEAVLGPEFGTAAGFGMQLSVLTGATVQVAGDFSGKSAFLGIRYEARFRFSEQYIKDQQNQVIASANIKIRRMRVTFANTGYFRAEVTPPGRPTNTYTYTSKTLGVSGVLLGSPTISSGHFLIPIMSSSRGVTIELVNDTPLPSAFQSAEWEGEMVVHSRR